MSSFYVKKNKSGSWSLVEELYQNGKRIQKVVPRELFPSIGVNPSGTVDDARKRIKQLNQKNSLEAHQAAAAARRAKFEENIRAIFVSDADASEFLTRLEEEYSYDRKMMSHWTTAQRIILELKIEPIDFEDRARAFYTYFRKHQFSLDYSVKLLRMLNLWGKFVSRKRRQPFEPIPAFDSKTRNDIHEAYLNKDTNRAGGAKPLTFSLLNKHQSEFLPGQWEWLYVSHAFGLRPKEIDGQWQISSDGSVDILHVYQTKLRGLASEQRWKLIPVLYPEQKKALAMLKLGGLKRPLCKTVVSVFGEGFGLYSGRKGFTDMMLDRGQSIEAISAWLGHRTIDRTWRHYKSRSRVQYKKPG